MGRLFSPRQCSPCVTNGDDFYAKLWHVRVEMKQLRPTLLPLLSCLLFTCLLASNAKEGELPRGSLVFKAADAKQDGNTHAWDFKAERWGMYEVRVAYSSEKETSATVTLGDTKFGETFPAGTNRIANLGRRYLAGQFKQTLEIFTDADLTYLLLEQDALTHAVKMRYEPKAKKNCLGFWTHPEDWAEWSFEVTSGGTFEVEVTQGCGGGGGSDVGVHVGEQTLNFVVEDTGGWQNWKARKIGTVTLEPGTGNLQIKPKNKKGGAVMDIQKIRLIKRVEKSKK